MAKPISIRLRLGQVNTRSDTLHDEFSSTSVNGSIMISGQRNFEEASAIIEACKFASQATISNPTPTNSEPNKVKIEKFGSTSENGSIRSGDSQNAFKDPSCNDGFIEVNINRIKQENASRESDEETFQNLQPESQKLCSSVESSVQETWSKVINDHFKRISNKEKMEKRLNTEFRIKENERRRQIEAAKKNSQATIAKQMSSKLSQVNIKSETHHGEFSGTSENVSIHSGGLSNFEEPYSTNDCSRPIIEVNFNTINQENTPRASDDEEHFQTQHHERQEWNPQCSSVESSMHESIICKLESNRKKMREKRSNPEFRIKENERRRQIKAAKKNPQATIAKQTSTSSKLSQVNIKSETHHVEFSGTSENVSILNGGLSNFEHPNYSTEVDSRQIIEVNFNTIKQENTPRASDDEELFQTQQHKSQDWNHQCSSFESSIHETSSKISKLESNRKKMREKRSNPEFRIKETERRRQIKAAKKNAQATIAKQTSTSSKPSQVNIKSETDYGEFNSTSENVSILSGGLSNFEHPNYSTKVDSRQIIEVNLNTIKQENTPRESDDVEPFQTQLHESQEWIPQCSSAESSIREFSSIISKLESNRKKKREKRSNPEFRIKENERRRQIRAAMKNSQAIIEKPTSRSSKLSQVSIESETHHGENVSILSGGGPSIFEDFYSTNDGSRPIIEVNFNTINQENTPRASDDEEPFQTLQHESQEWNPQCSSVESSIHETSSKISKGKSKREIMREKRSNPEFRIKENERRRQAYAAKKVKTSKPVEEVEMLGESSNSHHISNDESCTENDFEKEQFDEHDRERRKKAKQLLRQKPGYAEAERIKNRMRQRLKRQDPNYRERDRERLRLMQQRKRQDPNYQERERERLRLMQRRKRQDPAYVQNERIKNRLRQQLLRQDPSYLQNERIKNRLRKQLVRQDQAHLQKKK